MKDELLTPQFSLWFLPKRGLLISDLDINSMPCYHENNSAIFRPRYSKNKQGIIIAPPFTNPLPADARIFGCYCRNYCQFRKKASYQANF